MARNPKKIRNRHARARRTRSFDTMLRIIYEPLVKEWAEIICRPSVLMSGPYEWDPVYFKRFDPVTFEERTED